MGWKQIEFGPLVLAEDRLYSTVERFKTAKDRRIFLATSEEALFWLRGMGERNPFFIGDLWGFLKEHFPEECPQVMDATLWSESTLDNYAWVAASIPPSERRFDEGVEFTKHQAVAALPAPKRQQLLQEAVDGKLTLSGVRQQVRLLKRKRVAQGAGELKGAYRVIYADPPWQFDDQGRLPDGAGSTTLDHYDSMSIDDICAMPIPAHATTNAVLFLWAPVPLLLRSPGPREVLDAWGFTYKQKIVWSKGRHNRGHYLSNRHEDLLLATRGSCVPDRLVPMVENVQVIRASGEHSEKPPEFRKLIEQLYDGPYLELFARHQVDGWKCWGDQVGVLAA